jgi:hypothetical protein
MANFIHAREHLDRGDSVIVDCDTQCNVMLLSDTDFSNYRIGRDFHYHGGHYKRFPVSLSAPGPGYWNVVIDLGGGSANIKYSIRVVKI